VEDTPLSPAEAARYVEREWHLKVSAATVRRWVAREALPAKRTEGGRILIDRADLHAILDPKTATDGND